MDTCEEKRPDWSLFLGIISFVACLFIFVLQANGVEVNWQASTVIYLALIGVALWSLLRYAIPHLTNGMRYSLAVILFVMLGGLGFYATYKEFGRDYKVAGRERVSGKSASSQVPIPTAERTTEPLFTKPSPTVQGLLREPSKVVPAKSEHGGSTPELPIALAATIVNPSANSIVFENLSDRLAEGVTWELVMFRVSDAAFFSFATQNAGYIKAQSKTPAYVMNLTTLPKVDNGGKQLVDGDVLIGSLALDCPTCKGNTYIVYLVWNEGGWFSSVINENGGLLLPKGMSKAAVDNFLTYALVEVRPEHKQPIVALQ